MSNRNNKLALIRELVKDFSKVFPNIKNDDDTIAIWGKQLKLFGADAIELAKDRIIKSHSGYLYPNDFIKLVQSFSKEKIPEQVPKEIIPAKNVAEKISSLLKKLERN